MQQKKLLPKKYLSWTQFEMWRKSPDNYVKRYFAHSANLDTDEIRFGKMISEKIENWEIHEILPNLELFDIPEYYIEFEVDGQKCISYIDHAKEDLSMFREYKTGKKPWTPSRVQSHDQLVFYALAIRKKTGKKPDKCFLDWIVTDNKEPGTFSNAKKKEIFLTGEVKSFEREIFDIEIDRLEQEIIKTIQDISDRYHQYLDELY